MKKKTEYEPFDFENALSVDGINAMQINLQQLKKHNDGLQTQNGKLQKDLYAAKKYKFLKENGKTFEEYVGMLLSTQIQLFNRNSELITRECIYTMKNPILSPNFKPAGERENTKEVATEVTELMRDFATGKLNESQKILAIEKFAKYAENMSFSERQSLISLVILGKQLNVELQQKLERLNCDGNCINEKQRYKDALTSIAQINRRCWGDDGIINNKFRQAVSIAEQALKGE